ncbi:hypothetical protein FDUTEX481_01014 [Tolypothrix sp. PCC 7601]|nr:hypothetical protein FDUTEX481_01014 [Tolypothrix sp. PCC 7601]
MRSLSPSSNPKNRTRGYNLIPTSNYMAKNTCKDVSFCVFAGY